jgi:hypothetical protein
MALPAEDVARMEMQDVRDERIRVQGGLREVRLSSRGAQFLRNWMLVRGCHPGLLVTQSNPGDARPLSRYAMQATLHRRCAQAGIRRCNLEDIAGTQALLACGRWRSDCCCPLSLTASGEPYWPNHLNSDAIRFVSGLSSGERVRVLRLLEVVAGVVRPGSSVFELDWAAIDGLDLVRAVDIATASSPTRKRHAMQRCVDAMRFGVTQRSR